MNNEEKQNPSLKVIQQNGTVLELNLVVFLLLTGRTCLRVNIEKYESCSEASECNSHLQPSIELSTFCVIIPLIFVSPMSETFLC